jgi:peptidoglycan hydrolase FlgJ
MMKSGTIDNMNALLRDPQLTEQKDKKLKKACKDFEAILTYQVLTSMRKSVGKCDLFHGGEGEEIFQSLFDMQISKDMSDFGPNSLARLLYNQLKDQVSSSNGQGSGGTKAIGSSSFSERPEEPVK